MAVVDPHGLVSAARSWYLCASRDGEGRSLLELEFVDQLHAMTVMLRLGPDAIIVAPDWFRDEFTSYLERTLNNYEKRVRR